MEMSDVVINREPVELFKVLKFEGLVGSGGEAKLVIGNGLVQLNGKVETQKRKKVVSGDVIEFNDAQMTLVLEPST
jgi:ribosome-associated protein|tara:strand:+ start:945 stop:1172 length:228 start_codon:yes stop_codon:yes gene_type:complete